MPPRRSRRSQNDSNKVPDTSGEAGDGDVKMEVKMEQVSPEKKHGEAFAQLTAEQAAAKALEAHQGDVVMEDDEALSRAVKKQEDAFNKATAIIADAQGNPDLPNVSYKNPTMLLNEKIKGLKYETLSETGDSHNKCWTVSVDVHGEMFEGVGKNKKHAKQEASKYALIKLYNILCVPEEKSEAPQGGDATVAEGMEGDGAKAVTETGDDMQGKKRARERDGGSGNNANKRLKGQPMPKNALMQLYELKPGVQYTLMSQTGAVHAPMFTMSVEVNGQTFTGTGTSKKGARLMAAELALKSFLQFPNASDAHAALGHQAQQMNVDFTSDENVSIQNFDGNYMVDMDTPQSQNGNGPHLVSKKGKPIQNLEGKNPIMILNEMKPSLKYECISEKGDKSKIFTMSVTVDGEEFQGMAGNKRLAKARAAQSALNKLYNMTFSWGPSGMPVNNSEVPESYSDLADHVALLVQQKFAELTDDLTSQYARKKVLAGIVMTHGEELESAKVITVSTGTKCINGEYLSDQGTSVNDFHAEILTRRACICYLYSQLEMLATDDEVSKQQSIFEKASVGYKLKDDVKFHLYISTAPCGDSRIFSPHAKVPETKVEGSGSDRHPNRKARGQLRTKIESGEGTIPVKSSVGVQTWDGVMHGERLLTMSCSDKVARWNLLGIQGALMGLYVEPIYLSSIILGSLYHADHLARAMYKRFEKIEGLPEPYNVHKPNLSGINNPEQRQLVKAPNFAVDWTVGDSALEIINMTTGKLEEGGQSRLCKRELLKRFLRLNGRLATRDNMPKQSHVYSELKAMNSEYQEAKAKMIAHFEEIGLGLWVKKPIEQDEFQES